MMGMGREGGDFVNSNYVTLNETDRAILASYETVLDGLAEYLGDGYEMILHSLENLDKSAIKVINGHYTGREPGAPITDLALEMLAKIEESNEPKSLCYFTKNKAGAVLKSATIPVLGEKRNVIGLLCLNFHTEIAFAKMLASFVPGSNGTHDVMENFTESVDDLIATALNEARDKVMHNPSITTANKNKEIVLLLRKKGIFNIKDAVPAVAKLLNISKNTVYLHLRHAEKTTADTA